MRLAMVMVLAAWTAAGQVFPPPPTGGAQGGSGGEAMPPAPGPLYGAVRAAGTVRAGDAVVWGDAQGRTITGVDMENSAWASTGMVAAAVAEATAGMASTQQVAAVSNALAQADAAHAARKDNPHGVTAADIGALTNEQDLAALRTYHYDSPDVVESPAEWFAFDASTGTITGFNWATGREHVVIPWEIGGVPVTAIGANAFISRGIVSLIAPQTVTSIEDYAFASCTSLAYISLPQVLTVGNYAFEGCTLLASVSLPQVQAVGDIAFYNCDSLTSIHFDSDAPAIGYEIFGEITPNQVTNYVTNPQATGWGATLDGMPVVRLPLYADAIYQAGELVATTEHVAEQIAAIEFPVASTNYTAWTGTITPANGTATVSIAHGNMPVLVTTAPCVLTLDPTGYGTAGVSRVSLSYYTGTNALTFATNVIQYAETPTVDTSGWNTLLIRRVSDGAWKGVGL